MAARRSGLSNWRRRHDGESQQVISIPQSTRITHEGTGKGGHPIGSRSGGFTAHGSGRNMALTLSVVSIGSIGSFEPLISQDEVPEPGPFPRKTHGAGMHPYRAGGLSLHRLRYSSVRLLTALRSTESLLRTTFPRSTKTSRCAYRLRCCKCHAVILEHPH